MRRNASTKAGLRCVPASGGARALEAPARPGGRGGPIEARHRLPPLRRSAPTAGSRLKLAAGYPVRLICRATDWPRGSLYHAAAPAANEGRLRGAFAPGCAVADLRLPPADGHARTRRLV